MSAETWKPVHGWPYEVSNLGRVRRWGGKVLVPSVCGGGYRQVHLYDAPRAAHPLVHRLVAAAFIGSCPAGHEVNHKDGDKARNEVANLEYVTHSANIAHQWRWGLRGRLVPAAVDGKRRARLGEHDVLALRRMVRLFRTTANRVASTQAKRLGVSRVSLHHAITGRNWRDLPGACYAWNDLRASDPRVVYKTETAA